MTADRLPLNLRAKLHRFKPSWVKLPVFMSFFAYHGLWAPGVRLLRQLRTRPKTTLVFATVLLPLAVMAFQAVRSQQQQVTHVRTQQLGLQYADAALRLAELMFEQQHALKADKSLTAEQLDITGPVRLLSSADTVPELRHVVSSPPWEAAQAALQTLGATDPQAKAARLVATNSTAAALMALHRAIIQQTEVLEQSSQRLAALAHLGTYSLPALTVELAAVRHKVAELADSADKEAAGDPLLALRLDTSAHLGAAVHMAQDVRFAVGELPEGSLNAEGMKTGTTLGTVLNQLSSTLGSGKISKPAADLMPALEAHSASVVTLRKQINMLLDDGFDEAIDRVRLARNALFLLLSATLSVGVYLVVCFYKVTSGGLRELRNQMNRLASGDLTVRPTPLGRDEVADSMDALCTSVARLSDLIAAVLKGVSSVTQASRQIASGNLELSHRNHESKKVLGEAVSGVALYSKQLDLCSARIDDVVTAVQSLRLDSARSRKQMAKLRERMDSLQGESREISAIVGIIDGIAFRTNILALNASVEAAKAGEAGRGFAVVAQEVRSLAMRSAESARRIGDIVVRSTEDIAQGGALAQMADESLTNTDKHVDHIHKAMTDVVRLTREGQSTSGEILGHVKALSSASEENVNLVDQLAAASDALRRQGQQLAYKVDQFKLN